MKYTNLAEVPFEDHTSRNYPVAPINGYNRNEIFECYGKPSKIKVSIWNEWCDWCDDMHELGYECGIEIHSYNCNFFTIAGSVRKDDEVIDIWITARHNRMYRHYPI